MLILLELQQSESQKNKNKNCYQFCECFLFDDKILIAHIVVLCKVAIYSQTIYIHRNMFVALIIIATIIILMQNTFYEQIWRIYLWFNDNNESVRQLFLYCKNFLFRHNSN